MKKGVSYVVVLPHRRVSLRAARASRRRGVNSSFRVLHYRTVYVRILHVCVDGRRPLRRTKRRSAFSSKRPFVLADRTFMTSRTKHRSASSETSPHELTSSRKFRINRRWRGTISRPGRRRQAPVRSSNTIRRTRIPQRYARGASVLHWKHRSAHASSH